MENKNEDYNLSYADKAFIILHKIMLNTRKNMFEDVNRANKGELFVLHFLESHKNVALPSEIGAALHVSTARISALLGCLEKKGQIKREIDKNNRRNILVTITEEGQNRVKSEMMNIHSNMSKVFIEMGESDTNEFIRLIKKFSDLAQKNIPCKKNDKK